MTWAKLRRLDPLPEGRWLGATAYAPPEGPDAPLPEPQPCCRAEFTADGQVRPCCGRQEAA